MSVVMDVLLEESNRLSSLIELYDKKISEFPKGSISKKVRNGHIYYYLAYHDNEKVKFDYLGKEGSKKVEEYSMKILKRRKYEEKRKKSKANLDEVKKFLRVAG